MVQASYKIISCITPRETCFSLANKPCHLTTLHKPTLNIYNEILLMKKILLLLCWLTFSYCCIAQTEKDKTDSICSLVKKYFNEKDDVQLYSLAGETFKQQLKSETFSKICKENLFPLGEMKETILESSLNGLNKYKAVFASANISLLLRLDKADKIQTLLFQPYKNDLAKKSYIVPATNQLSSALDKEVDSVIRPYISMQVTTGISIGILKDGKTYFYGYGETAKGNGQIPDEKTYFEIGSISKTFTAILFADAANKGKVGMEDPINKYLPDSVHQLAFNNKPITLKTLANQSSGIPRLPDNLVLDSVTSANPYKDYNEKNMFAFYKKFIPVREPGSKYEYSNLAVATLAVILERVNHTSYEQLLFKTICGPLGMKDTRQLLRKQDSARFAKGYDENGIYSLPWDFKAFAGAGAIRSTAADLITYAKANLGAAPPDLYKAIQLTHTITFKSDDATVGLAWHYIKPGNDTVIFHNGGTGGYRSYLAMHPEKKYAVVILSNSAVAADNMGNQLMRWLEKN
jgi:CubicO group peptidase (beta-lactamase class C family)